MGSIGVPPVRTGETLPENEIVPRYQGHLRVAPGRARHCPARARLELRTPARSNRIKENTVKHRLIRLALVVALPLGIALFTGCASTEKREPSLYDRLGGEQPIAAVCGDLVDRLAGDPKVNVTRKGQKKTWDPTPENVALLKKRLTQFVCKAAGGPQKYEGKDMKTAHAGMGVSEGEFNLSAEHLKASLAKFGVPKREQDDLLAAVEAQRKDIVERKGM
ncbi:hypothetical protein RAS1_25710 [Phycisphaerae bacterium RAS1]|nr:hypothetical protein RAS1_25710 [Phycisphaerae bacterium RAS1]